MEKLGQGKKKSTQEENVNNIENLNLSYKLKKIEEKINNNLVLNSLENKKCVLLLYNIDIRLVIMFIIF